MRISDWSSDFCSSDLGLNLGFRDAAALAQVLVEGARIGMDLGDAQLLARYERWRSLDTFMVAAATDGLTRLYGVPGRNASFVDRQSVEEGKGESVRGI